jgi:hypothetical protein
VLALVPQPSDELLILARGKSVQSWRLADIKRDDYAPNAPGQRQWEFDRKDWLAKRLTGLMAVRVLGFVGWLAGFFGVVVVAFFKHRDKTPHNTTHSNNNAT